MENIKWQLDKKISLAHIVTTITMIVGGLMWLNAKDKRIDLNAQSIIYLQQRVSENRNEIREDLKQINEKLDRINERLQK